MKFSIVIPTRNRQETLRRCLAAAMNQDYPDYEVIVVDDASSDGTEDLVRDEFPQVRYLRQEINRGPAAARNCAIQEARGDIIAFTDDDCVPPTNWLQRHLEYYDDQIIGAVGGPQTPRLPNFFDKVEIAHYADEYRGLKRITRVSDWEGLATSNMSVRRVVFEEIGFFDEQFLTGADPEFARRINRAGYVLVRDPSLSVEHLKVHTLCSYLRMRFRRGCGSILADIKADSLGIRRFVPFLNIARAWQDWRNFREMFGGGQMEFFCFWGLLVISRWADITGRIYYYWTVGRSYRPLTQI
ncbi:MAG: glycosyltransferase family 2 protein [Anaerolineae bacterium]